MLAIVVLVPLLFALAGCGGGALAADSSGSTFSVSPGTVAIDTNCAGCNDGTAELFSASGAGSASVSWSVSGGDATAGTGTISTAGVYTPPAYLTADSVQVTITATLSGNAQSKATATLTLTPGFLQPLTPENVALGAGESLIIKGFVAEAGGTDGINYALSSSAFGTSGGQGSLSAPDCVRNINSGAFTYCTVTYTAPAAISQTGTTYIVASVGSSSSKESAIVLLNTQNVESNPATHQAESSTPVYLGSSGGNNNDYDTATHNGQTYVTDCCGGTLGALVTDGTNQYLLSNNHVLARSDQAQVGEAITQPGLIDDNCTPFGQGDAAVTPVGMLTGYVPIKSASTNVDAAIAVVNAGAVDPSGSILELGAKQTDGSLAAAPPGTSSTTGKGESATLAMVVAKSGRTTGLTCASISALSLDVQVSYYGNCAETKSYYTKTYTSQIGITGNQFSDAGDSGSLVVDTLTAEPVGLFFAGGVSANGQSEGVANPVGEVLSELSSNVGNGATTYTFVGGPDHQVSCLNYGSGTAAIAQAHALAGLQINRTEQAVMQARSLVNSRVGILGVAMGKSSDHSGEGAVVVYVDPSQRPTVPQTIGGLRTEVISASAQAVAMGTAPQSLVEAGAIPPLAATVLRQAVTAKQQVAESLMKQNPAFFGVGVGQSLDNPKEAALVVYVDRSEVPAQLPATINGLRTHYIIMDRLHVTRSYLSATPTRSHCMPHPLAAPDGFGLLNSKKLRGLDLY